MRRERNPGTLELPDHLPFFMWADTEKDDVDVRERGINGWNH